MTAKAKQGKAVVRFQEFTGGPVATARRLLGQRLVRVVEGERLSGVIVEVEAYLGKEDRAAHTFGGRRTPRNEVMYAEGGRAYVYFTYGMHHCLNVVCGTVDEGVAVLIRALEPAEGLERMWRNRPRVRQEHDLLSGPGKLCQALEIDLELNGIDLRKSGALWIERRLARPLPRSRICIGPRIGISSAGEWAGKPLRFFIRTSRGVSR